MKQTRGLGSTYLRGNTWWISYSVRGQRHLESSGSTNHADAVRQLKQRIAEVKSGKAFGSQVDKTTLGDLIDMLQDDYKANKRRLGNIKAPVAHLIAHFGKDRLAIDITTDVITKYVTKRLEPRQRQVRKRLPDGGYETVTVAEVTASGTINRSLAALKCAFRLAERAGKVAQRPYISMLDERDNVREGFVTVSEFERLRDALPADLRDPAVFLYYSAWRVGEMRSLEWRDIKNGEIRLRAENSKNKHGRVVPLTRELAEIIERARERRITELPNVFHRDNGTPIRLFRKSWATACKAAGLGHVLVHDFRRSALKNLMDTGMVSEKVAMTISGHKTRSTFERYHIVTNDAVKKALEAVSDHLAAQPRTVAVVLPFKRTAQ